MPCATCGTTTDYYPNYLADNDFCRYECMVEFLGYDPNEQQTETEEEEEEAQILFNETFDYVFNDKDFTNEDKECNICLQVKNTRNTNCCKVNNICFDCYKGVLTNRGNAPCPFCRNQDW